MRGHIEKSSSKISFRQEKEEFLLIKFLTTCLIILYSPDINPPRVQKISKVQNSISDAKIEDSDIKI